MTENMPIPDIDGEQCSLRNRIAAVLNRHKADGDRYNEWSDCQCGHVGTRWDDHVADAVIAELGLEVERCPCAYRGPNCATRYVTDWKADDE